MSVLAFDAIQDTVASMLTAAAYFAGETVITHSGDSLAEVEAALQAPGQCVVVLPPSRGGDAANGLGAARMICQIGILCLFNPETATKDIAEYVQAAIEVVIAYRVTAVPQDRFGLVDLDLISDEGLFGYMVNFSKAVEFRAS